jgi:hypothetical protein
VSVALAVALIFMTPEAVGPARRDEIDLLSRVLSAIVGRSLAFRRAFPLGQ